METYRSHSAHEAAKPMGNNQERPVFNPNISNLLPAPFKIPGNPHAAMKVTVGSICRVCER